jgi:hypothetical protein
MNIGKTRWNPVGAGWNDKKGEGFRLVLSLGIFGEITILMKPNRDATGSQPQWSLIAQADSLPLNMLRLLSNTGVSTSGNTSGDETPPDSDIPLDER